MSSHPVHEPVTNVIPMRQIAPADGGSGKGGLSSGRAGMPHQVTQLLKREREIAFIVYAGGSVTAKDVQKWLSQRLSNAAVRSMLNRLVAKGLVRRELVGREFEYRPALTKADSQASALRQFADDYFDGSVSSAAATIAALLRKERSMKSELLHAGR